MGKIGSRRYPRHLIPCDHGEVLLDPHVKMLADQITQALKNTSDQIPMPLS